MNRDRDFERTLEFKEFTPTVLDRFLNSAADFVWVQGFEDWSDVQEFRVEILNTPPLTCEIFVKQDCGESYEVETFEDISDLYDSLYGDELLEYFKYYTPEEIEGIMAYPDHQHYEGFEDLISSEYFKAPTEGNINFWFDDYSYIYYVTVKIYKK